MCSSKEYPIVSCFILEMERTYFFVPSRLSYPLFQACFIHHYQHSVTFSRLGSLQILGVVVVSKIIGLFLALDVSAKNPADISSFEDSVTTYIWVVFGFGIAALISYGVSSYIWDYVAEKSASEIKEKYFYSIIDRDVSWFYSPSSVSLINQLTGNIIEVIPSINSGIGNAITDLSMAIGGFIAAFIASWRLSLLLLVAPFIIVVSTYFLSLLVQVRVSNSKTFYGSLMGRFSFILYHLDTIAGYKRIRQEKSSLETEFYLPLPYIRDTYAILRVAVSTSNFVVYSGMSLAIYYGTYLLLHGYIDSSQLLIQSIISLSVALGALDRVVPVVSISAVSKGLATILINTIDQFSPSCPSTLHSKPILLTNRVDRPALVVNNLSFVFPGASHPTLRNVSFSLSYGNRAILFGFSGAGKTSLLKLMMKIYPPSTGSIFLEEIDYEEIASSELYKHVTYISGTLSLIKDTLYNNVVLGCLDVEASPEEVQRLLAFLGLEELLSSLPLGLNTVVGDDSETSLTQAHVQLIIFARALIRKPRILLLDDPFTYLDALSIIQVRNILFGNLKKSNNENEWLPSDALVILATHDSVFTKHASEIFVICEGRLVEQGDHAALMRSSTLYYKLLRSPFQDSRSEIRAHMTPPSAELRPRRSSCLSDVYSPEQTKRLSLRVPSKSSAAEIPSWIVLKTMLQWMLEERGLFIFGLISSLIFGLVIPGYALLIAQFQTNLSLPPVDLQVQENIVSFFLLVLACCAAFFGFIGFFFFGYGSEKIAANLRVKVANCLLSKPLSFYSDLKNSPEHLLHRISVDTTILKDFLRPLLGLTASFIVSLVAGLIIAFIYAWQLTFIILGLYIVVVVTASIGYLRIRTYNARSAVEQAASGRTAVSWLRSVEAIKFFMKEKHFREKYHSILKRHTQIVKKYSVATAIIAALNGSLIFFMYALAFGVSKYFFVNETLSLADILNCIYAIIFCTLSAGILATFVGGFSRTVEASRDLMELSAEAREDSSYPEDGELPFLLPFTRLEFKAVYILSGNQPLLKDFSFKASAPANIVFFDASGYSATSILLAIGKLSSIDSGLIQINDKSLDHISTSYIRDNIAFSSHNPCYFKDRSIIENILYGNLTSSLEDVYSICSELKLHELIMTKLPEGYDTIIENYGIDLSLGEYQRLTLARAFLKDRAKIRLWDNLSVNLDLSLQQHVTHMACNKFTRDGLPRLNIFVTSFFRRFQDMDTIFILFKGRIIEMGSYEQLSSDPESIYSALIDNSQMY